MKRVKSLMSLPKTRRPTLESLETRRLLTAAVMGPAYDALTADATDLLVAETRRVQGVSDALAELQIASIDVSAPSSDLTLNDVDYWSTVSRVGDVTPTIEAVTFETASLSESRLRSALADAPNDVVDFNGGVLSSLPVLALPSPDGGLARFAVERYELLAPEVAIQMPAFDSFRLYGLDDLGAVGTATLTSSGFSSFIAGTQGDWQVEPVEAFAGRADYASFFSAHQAGPNGKDGGHPPGCFCAACLAGTDGVEAAAPTIDGPAEAFTFGQTRRTFELAIGTTAEWTSSAGGTQQNAFNTAVSRVNTLNAIYRRDFNVELQVVSDLRTIYTNANTDPYTDNNISAMMGQNQSVMDSVYGFANYDVGHAFSANGGGGVVSGRVGNNFNKGRGVTGVPAFSSFFMPVFLHEVGHQFNAAHTWNTTRIASLDADQRAPFSAYEPGPGSTIMSYGDNGYQGSFVNQIGLYFHNHSIQQVSDYLQTFTASNAADTSPTGNVAPTVDAPNGVKFIPTNTPFELTAVGSDDQTLTYTWEQYDLGDADPIGVDDGDGPLFRSRDPSTNPTRMFPELADILANRSDADERLPQVNRTNDLLSFRVTARDGLGGVSDDEVAIGVFDTGSAFAITSQNNATNWVPNQPQTVTWNVANTDNVNFDAVNVDVFLSLDNGQTFSLVGDNTPNDGSFTFTVPNAPDGTTARVKVKAANNYFFDINNAPITIDSNVTVPNGLPATLIAAADGTAYLGADGDIDDNEFALYPGTQTPNLANGSDIDSYIVAGDEAGVYTFTATPQGTSFIFPVLAVYDATTGAALAGQGYANGSDTTISINLAAGQRVIVATADQGNSIGGNVELTIDGPSVAVVTPITLDANGNATLNGTGLTTLSDGGDSDYYSFTVPADSSGNGEVDLAIGGVDAILSLYDANDNLLAVADAGGVGAVETIDSGFVAGQTYRLRVGAADYVGSGDYVLSLNFGSGVVIPDAPGTPMLAAVDDTGTVGDAVTSVNNDLEFAISSPTETFVRLFRDGVQVGGSVIAGVNNVAVVTDTEGPFADGTYVYTATAAATFDGPQSPLSGSLTVVIDTTAPVVGGFAFNFDSGAGDQSFTLTLDEPGLAAGDIVVTNTTTNAVVPASSFDLIDNGDGSYELVFNPTTGNDVLGNGVFEVSVAADAVTDTAGNGNAAFVGTDFFLNGDANRDGTVSILDFAVLRGNFGSSGASFTSGDFNYDGTVSILDFAILRGNFGQNVSVPSSIFAEDENLI